MPWNLALLFTTGTNIPHGLAFVKYIFKTSCARNACSIEKVETQLNFSEENRQQGFSFVGVHFFNLYCIYKESGTKTRGRFMQRPSKNTVIVIGTDH